MDYFDSISPQSVWAGLAILLVFIELLAPAFLFIFLAFGALLTAGLLIFFPGIGLGWQLLVFSGGSLLVLGLFRKRMLRKFQPEKNKQPYHDYEGITGRLEEATTEHHGRVYMRGSSFVARTEKHAPPLVPGQTVKVVRMEGTIAIVSPL